MEMYCENGLKHRLSFEVTKAFGFVCVMKRSTWYQMDNLRGCANIHSIKGVHLMLVAVE